MVSQDYTPLIQGQQVNLSRFGVDVFQTIVVVSVQDYRSDVYASDPDTDNLNFQGYLSRILTTMIQRGTSRTRIINNGQRNEQNRCPGQLPLRQNQISKQQARLSNDVLLLHNLSFPTWRTIRSFCECQARGFGMVRTIIVITKKRRGRRVEETQTVR